MRSKDAQKQLARMSLTIYTVIFVVFFPSSKMALETEKMSINLQLLEQQLLEQQLLEQQLLEQQLLEQQLLQAELLFDVSSTLQSPL